MLADREIHFPHERFADLCDIRTCAGRDIGPASLSDVDILLIRSVTRVDAELLATSDRLRCIGSATSGADHVDVALLDARGIDFFHARGCNALSVAEYVLSCLCALACERRMRVRELSVAIVGCGHVGRCLHGLLDRFGIRCLLNDPPLQEAGVPGDWCALAELRAADVISLHVPLSHTGTHATRNLIDADFLAGCASGTLLINTARGGVVDESVLVDRLRHDSDMLAVVDVWADEPNVKRELLRLADITTPHIAGLSRDARRRAGQMLAVALAEWCGEEASDLSVSPSPVWLPDSGDEVHGCQEVLALYDVREDSVRMRTLLELDETSGRSYFDALRRRCAETRSEFASKVARAHRE